jgi:hypothetical protein
MCGDGPRLLRRAAWKHLPNRFSHSHRQNLIRTIHLVDSGISDFQKPRDATTMVLPVLQE